MSTPVYTHGAWGLPLLWLDFETYYSTKDGYTLSKMTPEEYVRDARFQVIGLCAVLGDGQTLVSRGPEQTLQLLQLLDVSRYCVVSHNNGGFDGVVLTMHYGMRPGAAQCTIDMARPHMPAGQSLSLRALSEWAGLPPKGHEVVMADGKRFEDFTPAELEAYMGVYCPRDVHNCRGLYHVLRSMFYSTPAGEVELDVLSESILCSIVPHYQDDPVILAEEVERLTRLDEERERRLLALFNIDQKALHKFLGSGKRLAAFFEAMGVQVPMKVSKSDPNKMGYAFAKDDEAFTRLATPDEWEEDEEGMPWHLDEEAQQIVADVVTARLGVKSSIRRNRAERMLAISRRGPYVWPITWRGAGNTGRWAALSAARTNWQNVPIERRKGYPQEALRRARKAAPAIVGMAPEPKIIVSADSSQIEARGVVTAAGQEDMRVMFEQNAPIYEHMAQQIYGRVIGKDDPERQVGKFTVLGAGFGAGGSTLYKQMRKAKVPGITPAISDAAVQTYRHNAEHVTQTWRDWNMPLRAIEKGRSHAGLVLQFGPPQQGTNVGRQMFIVEFTDVNSFRVWLPSGRCLYYRDIRWEMIKTKGEEGWTYMGREERPDGRVVASRTSLYGAKLFQNWVQAVACDAIAYAAWLMRKNYGHTLAGNTHDELSYIATVSTASAVLDQLIWCMRQRPAWMPNLPLNAEGKWGLSYADV